VFNKGALRLCGGLDILKLKKNSIDLNNTVCVKYLTMTFLVGLPAKIDNPVHDSQVRFQQFRVIERFCVESSNKHSDRGTL